MLDGQRAALNQDPLCPTLERIAGRQERGDNKGSRTERSQLTAYMCSVGTEERPTPPLTAGRVDWLALAVVMGLCGVAVVF